MTMAVPRLRRVPLGTWEEHEGNRGQEASWPLAQAGVVREPGKGSYLVWEVLLQPRGLGESKRRGLRAILPLSTAQGQHTVQDSANLRMDLLPTAGQLCWG